MKLDQRLLNFLASLIIRLQPGNIKMDRLTRLVVCLPAGDRFRLHAELYSRCKALRGEDIAVIVEGSR